MALQLAENPQTGERIALINGRWVPFTEMAQNPQTGERAVKVDGLWYTGAGQAPQQPPAPTPPQEESGFFRQAADVPVQVATGVATGVRLIADAFGADNPVSQNIRGVEDYLQSLLSAQAKNDQQEIARIMKAAEDQGIGANLRAALEAFATAPVDLIAQAAGTALPTIAGGLAGQALKASAALASTGVGAVMGAGTVKSSIYDEVKQTLTDLGASPEEAEKKAILAQEYGGENLDQILLGTVIGGAAGRFGIESNVAKQLAGEISKKSIGKAAIEEAIPEAVQAGQEQVAQNVALQREGQDVPTFRGAVGAGALEALAGAGLGGIGEAATRRLRPEAPVEEPPITTEEEPEQKTTEEVSTATPPSAQVTPPAERAGLLADMEDVEGKEGEDKKFEETVAKIKAAPEGDLGVALNVARSRVQESNKTSAPYIQNAVNKYKPEGMRNITLSEASQIRQMLVDEGIIMGKDKVKKVEPVVTAPTAAETVRVYHSGSQGEGDSGRFVSTDKQYAADYRKDLPLFYLDLPANDPRLQGAYPDQGAKQGFTFNFELTPEEATRLKPIEREPAKVEKAAEGKKPEEKNVSTADATAAEKAQPRGRGKRAAVSVSGEPAATTTKAATGTVDAGMGAAANTAARVDTRAEPSATPLAPTEVIETPQEKYESLQRRLEGLVNARRVPAIPANRMRTMLRTSGNPLTNPQTYSAVHNQVEEFVKKAEQYAESLEAEDTTAGIDRRERNLRLQETNALQRAQARIAQDDIAQSLRESYDRKLTEEELMPKYAREMREVLDTGDLKTVTQLLVEKRAAANVYPGKRGEKLRPIFETVAKKLNEIDFSNVNVQTEATVGANPETFKRLMRENKNAEYDPATNTLYVRRDKVNGWTIMHELVHAGTVQAIRRYQIDGLARETQLAKQQLSTAQKIEDKEVRKVQVKKAQAQIDLIERQKLGVERLAGLFEFAQNQTSDLSLATEFPRAFDNVYEFIAYGMTNPEFQSRLARLEVSMPVGSKNIWTEFVKAIANLFGVELQTQDGTSALSELGQAFSEIVAAPTKEGITGVSPLAETGRKKAEKEPRPEIDPYEETSKQYDAIRGDKLTLKGLIKNRISAKNIEELVRRYQDRQRPLLRLQTDLDRAGLAIWASADQQGNTLAASNDESAGRYENNEKSLAPLMINMNKAMSAYASKTGISIDDAMKKLGTYFTAEANQVRRLTNYLKEKPLKTKPTIRLKGSDKLISPAEYRDMLIDSVLTEDVLDDATRNAIHARLMQLAGMEIGADGEPRRSADAAKYEDPLGASYSQLDKEGKARKPGKRPVDFKDPYYDIIKDWSYSVNEKVINDMKQDMVRNGIEIRAVKKAMEALDKATLKFNEEATHLTQPAKNLIKLYGWGDKYVPLMGKVKSESSKLDQFIYMNTVPNEILPGFRGRETAPDNVILMTMINAGKAATRAARADIVPTLVNLMKPHPKTGKTYVKGEMVGVIKFKDRYKGEINFDEIDSKGGKKWTGQNKFYNYLKNGDIEVWRVDNDEIIQSLRPDWQPSKGVLDRAKNVSRTLTSWIGQGHTRYQLKFAIYDFPRNLFANAGALASEMGGSTAFKYLGSVGREVFTRARIPQVWVIADAHSKGDWAKIQKIGGYNEKTNTWKDNFVRDTYRYLQRGGKISIVRSWQTRSRLEQLVDAANKSDIRKGAENFKAALDRIFDLWLDGFELVARVQAFRVASSYAENARKMSLAEAEQFGVYFAKNLANFEKRAIVDLPAALYAFWPPSATGAVRAIDAITPALRLTTPKMLGGTSIEGVLEELPDEIKNDPKARAAYAKRYNELKRNGQGAIAFYAGVGFMMYMMALSVGASVKELFDDEEDPKNPVQEDTKELWARNIRIPLGWLDLPAFKDKYLQIPWGFGMGAFGAIGAQAAAVMTNGQTKGEFTGNVATIMVDSFLPLPFARYNPFDSPFNWIMSSTLPTILRPAFELGVNMSGLGQSIYRSYYNRFGPAFAGSENVEEMYRDVAKYIREASLGKYQPDPNVVRYIMTAYGDGIAGMAADIYNQWLLFGSESKDFDPKTDMVVFDNFIGNKVSPSFIKFEKANDKLEDFKKRYDSFVNDPNPANVERFLAEYPDAPGIVAIYNKQISNLRQFREATVFGEVYSDTPQERKNYKKEMNKIRDVYMDQVTALYEAYKDKID